MVITFIINIIILKNMLRDIVLLSVLLAAVYCQQCNYVIASETIASEDLYFERATSSTNMFI